MFPGLSDTIGEGMEQTRSQDTYVHSQAWLANHLIPPGQVQKDNVQCQSEPD